VRVYEWDLPEDTGPLREAVRRIAAGAADVVLFTTSVQVEHLFRVAAAEGLEQAVREGLRRAVIGSIGPTTTEMLEEYGLKPDVAPTHPKMGFLVRETAEQARHILEGRRKAP
jgi:uroporphyrinogen-III synthase